MTALLTDNLPLLAGAPNGIKKLRELILELAVRGKLVPQDPSDEPANELLARIASASTQLVAGGKAKKGNIKGGAVAQGVGSVELPTTWTWTSFDDLIDPEYPIAYGVLVPGPDVADGIPFVRIADLDLVAPPHKPEKSISQEVDRQFERTRIRGGEILMGVVGSIGKLGIAPESWAGANIARAICRLVPSEHVSKGYIIWLLQSDLMRKQFLGDTRTLAQPTLNVGLIRSAATPLPPLAEQHRIVAKVDELMALCDRLETQQADAESAHAQLVQALLDSLTQASDATDFAANWQRLAEHFHTLFTTEPSIDALKQTLLQLAVMGKLVSQDPSDEPASELLKLIAEEKRRLLAEGQIKKQKQLPEINEEERPFQLPKSWIWTRLGNLAGLITSGSRDWAQHYSEEGAIFVRMGNLSRRSYELRLNNIQRVSPPKDGEGSRTKLEAGDLLISITGEVGLLGLIPDGFGEAYINQHVCLVRFVRQLQGRFLPEMLRSSLAYDQYEAPQRGIKNSFRLTDVSEMLVPLPPLTEQHRIVAKVDQLMVLCDQLKNRLTQARQLNEQLASTLVEQAVA